MALRTAMLAQRLSGIRERESQQQWEATWDGERTCEGSDCKGVSDAAMHRHDDGAADARSNPQRHHHTCQQPHLPCEERKREINKEYWPSEGEQPNLLCTSYVLQDRSQQRSEVEKSGREQNLTRGMAHADRGSTYASCEHRNGGVRAINGGRKGRNLTSDGGKVDQSI